MIINSEQYKGVCICGKEHRMVTRGAVIEGGVLKNFEAHMASYHITGKRCVLYDENTYRATQGLHPLAQQEIILSPDHLHADEVSTAEVLRQLQPDIELIIAVGSGTIHDIARYCAHDKNLRFVAVPTAASVDGFCSTVAAMTWYGFKKTLPAVAPEIVLADIDIIKLAPAELVKSGVGDILAKYIALADWKIANLLTGEYLCPRIYDVMAEALEMVVSSVPRLEQGDGDAYAAVMYGLLMSGIAMQMMGNSRPASGAEHHISHFTEVRPAGLTVKFDTLHGEKTGVGAVIAAREYHRLAQKESILGCVKAAPMPIETVRAFFGGHLGDAIVEENEKDCLDAVNPEKLISLWPKVRQIVAAIPSGDTLYALLEKLDTRRTPEDIGLDPEQHDLLLRFSPYARNRLTLMRIRRMLAE